MARPTRIRVVLAVGLGSVGHGALQVLVQGPGQADACLTVGGRGEIEFAQVTQVSDGGVAVEDLLQEQVNGDDGVEVAFAPAVPEVAAELFDKFGGYGIGDGALDGSDGLRDTTHGGLRGCCWYTLHHCRRPPSLPGEPIYIIHRDLRLIYMAFGTDPGVLSQYWFLLTFRHLALDYSAQFSTLNPGTADRSLSVVTTVQFPRVKAIAAIWMSICCMGWPIFLNSAMIRPNSWAAAVS